MRKQDNLVQFINSMAAAEKRFFREYIKKSELKGGYINLFNILEGAPKYNAEETAAKLGLSKKKLAHEKERLQQLVLRCSRLWTEHAGTENTFELLNRVQEINLLTKRSLWAYAYDLGKSAAASALAQERYLHANMILNSNSECLAVLGDYAEAIQLKEAVIRNNRIIMENDELSMLQLRLIEKLSTGRVEPSQFEFLPEHPLMKTPNNDLLSFNARMIQSALWCYYYEDVQKDNDKLLHYVIKIYDLCLACRNAPYFDATQMAVAISHLSQVLSMQGRYPESLQKLDELDEWLLQHKKKAPGIYKFERYSELQRLVIYNNMGRFDATCEAAGAMVKVVKEDFLGYNEALLFYYAIALFHTGKNDMCLKVLQKLLSIESRTRQELLVPTRILFIMAQYETGNLRLIPHMVKALNAFLKRVHNKIQNGSNLFKLFSRLAKSDFKPMTPAQWSALEKKIKDDDFSENIREVFIGRWLKRKCQHPAIL
jgi:hypothetical protein